MNRSSILGWGLVLSVFLSFFLVASGETEPVPPLLINEVELNPAGRDAGAEWVEILNVGDSPIDLSGWRVTYNYRGPGSVPIVIEETVIGPGERYVFTYPSLMLRNGEPTAIELIDPEGEIADRTPVFTDTSGNDCTWQRFPDGGDPFFPDVWLFVTETKGRPNS